MKSFITTKYQFENLSLTSVDLTTVSFIDCDFKDGANFTGSAMAGASFICSRFECPENYSTDDFEASNFFETPNFVFDSVKLEDADFRDAYLCIVRFTNTDLAYADFKNIHLSDVSFVGSNLIYENYDGVSLVASEATLANSNMSDTNFDSRYLDYINDWKNLLNVVLPNDTWSNIYQRNSVQNGDVETSVSSVA
ncbi:unnamed protein product [Rotaria sp. Silwood1]|nr:unnamed protein product [Rotaria sp. Silwood1]